MVQVWSTVGSAELFPTTTEITGKRLQAFMSHQAAEARNNEHQHVQGRSMSECTRKSSWNDTVVSPVNSRAEEQKSSPSEAEVDIQVSQIKVSKDTSNKVVNTVGEAKYAKVAVAGTVRDKSCCFNVFVTTGGTL